MKFFVQTTAAPAPKHAFVPLMGVVLAVVFISMVIAQLFTFEKFPDVVALMGLPGDILVADIRAALIVVFEVFALPFLLSMRVSPLMRVVSMMMGWIAAIAWLGVSIRLAVTGSEAMNSGILGATVSFPTGVWAITFSAVLAVAVGYVSWAMWPHARRK